MLIGKPAYGRSNSRLDTHLLSALHPPGAAVRDTTADPRLLGADGQIAEAIGAV